MNVVVVVVRLNDCKMMFVEPQVNTTNDPSNRVLVVRSDPLLLRCGRTIAMMHDTTSYHRNHSRTPVHDDDTQDLVCRQVETMMASPFASFGS